MEKDITLPSLPSVTVFARSVHVLGRRVQAEHPSRLDLVGSDGFGPDLRGVKYDPLGFGVRVAHPQIDLKLPNPTITSPDAPDALALPLVSGDVMRVSVRPDLPNTMTSKFLIESKSWRGPPRTGVEALSLVSSRSGSLSGSRGNSVTV